VSPIHPSVWQRIGQSDADKHRQTVDEKLRNASREFATAHGKRAEMIEELAWRADHSKNDEEWHLLPEQREPPVCSQYVVFTMFCRQVLSEGHVG